MLGDALQKKTRVPVYVHELAPLARQRDYEANKCVIKHAEALIRRKTGWGHEIAEHGTDLAIALAAMQDTDDVGQVVDALESTHLATPDAPPDHAPPPECKVGASLRAEIEGLAEAARRKRGRQMEIASRWAAGDTEADFSIQVFGDGEGRMRRDPFLPKEPLPAPPTDNLSRLLCSFREAVSSALYR